MSFDNAAVMNPYVGHQIHHRGGGGGPFGFPRPAAAARLAAELPEARPPSGSVEDDAADAAADPRVL